MKDLLGNLLSGESVSYDIERTFVDADQTTLTGDLLEIETTTGVLTLTLHIKNSAGVPLPGWATKDIIFSATGTGNTFTPIDSISDRNGDYRVSFSSTENEVKIITVSVKNIAITQNYSVVVTTPGVVTPLFFSDFSTATGTSSLARSDNSKWNIVGDLTIIANPGNIGMPSNMVNVAQVPWYPVAGGGATNRKGGLTAPSPEGLSLPNPGDLQYYRWYYENEQPNGTVDEQTHPVQDGAAAGTLNWELAVRNDVDGGYYGNQILLNSAVLGNVRIFQSPRLDKFKTYRYEVKLTVISTTEFKLSVRVYDEAISTIVPILTDADYVQTSPLVGSPPTMEEYFVSQNHVFLNFDYVEGLNIGVNDGGQAGEEGIYGHQGGVAITRNTVLNETVWVGPYGTVKGENNG